MPVRGKRITADRLKISKKLSESQKNMTVFLYNCQMIMYNIRCKEIIGGILFYER